MKTSDLRSKEMFQNKQPSECPINKGITDIPLKEETDIQK
jgi:hypothetical protein